MIGKPKTLANLCEYKYDTQQLALMLGLTPLIFSSAVKALAVTSGRLVRAAVIPG
jgi:hypothetical protein